jgi:hypothetical protein
VDEQEREGTGVGGKLVNNRFTPEYQELTEGMNLVQMKHTRSLKAYVRDFNAQMNATPKMDEFFLRMWQRSSKLRNELK